MPKYRLGFAEKGFFDLHNVDNQMYMLTTSLYNNGKSANEIVN
jgi:hypothetical protein